MNENLKTDAWDFGEGRERERERANGEDNSPLTVFRGKNSLLTDRPLSLPLLLPSVQTDVISGSEGSQFIVSSCSGNHRRVNGLKSMESFNLLKIANIPWAEIC